LGSLQSTAARQRRGCKAILVTAIPSSPRALHVLHVEDNPIDADLVQAVLSEQWPDCRITVVHTRTACIEALQSGHFDVILSDSSLPQFDGLSALALARQVQPKTPFLFLSGAIGEKAEQALQQGAAGYLSKDDIDGLVPVIHRALDQAR
jgi:CheY-like chemotaxis protein